MAIKDWLIVRIRTYADDKVLKKHKRQNDDGSLPRQHHDRAKSYAAFMYEFYEYVTGKSHREWMKTYFISTMECLSEHIKEHHNIHQSHGEAYETFLLPLTEQKTVDWIVSTCDKLDLPCRIMKKAHTFYADNYKVSTIFRDSSIESTKELFEEHPEIKQRILGEQD